MKLRRVIALCPFVLVATLVGACASPSSESDRVTRVAIGTGDVAGSAAQALYVSTKAPAQGALLALGAAWMERDLHALASGLSGESTVVFADLRGRGRSTTVPRDDEPSLARDVEDLEALRAGLRLERFSLFAWSFDAAVALHYARTHPERVERMVLVSPLPPKRAPYWRTFLERFAREADGTLVEELSSLQQTALRHRHPGRYGEELTRGFVLLRSAVETREAAWARMRSRPYVLPNLDPDRVAQRGQAVLEALGEWDWTESFAALDVPVLIVHGRADFLPIGGSEAWVELLPSASLVALEDVGHLPWLEEPELFLQAVLAFLRPAGAGRP